MKPRGPVVAALAAALLLPAGARADDDGTTHIDALTVHAAGGFVDVSGSASFADQTRMVGEDPTGDAATPVPGTDIAALSIARPDPRGGPLVFRMELADQLPSPVSGIPVVYYYNWEIDLTSPSGQTGVTYLVQASRMLGSNPTNANPVFRVLRYNEAGGCGCSVVGAVPGTMEGDAVEWRVPAALIGAQGGHELAQAGDVSTTIGYGTPVTGNTWYTEGYLGDTARTDPYLVPGATVSLVLSPSGSPGTVVRSGSAAVTPEGAFQGALGTTGLAPGTYRLTATACSTPASCGSATRNVEV